MIAKDKRLHFAAGAFSSLAVIAVTGNPLWGLAAAAIVGAAKEAYDATGKGRVEFMDFAATALGGAVVSAVAMVAL